MQLSHTAQGHASARLRTGSTLIGVAGLPGSGKTTAAIAALDGEVTAAFSAVCWLDSGASTPLQPADVRVELARQLSGSPDPPPSRAGLAQLAADLVWAAAGSVDTDLSLLSSFELYRADIANRRVTTFGVVEALDVGVSEFLCVRRFR
jgi:hypothetical protein